MKILIVGLGKVGFAIARQLEGENHDLTLVGMQGGAGDQKYRLD